jgi:hypothetical protein
MRDPHIEPGTNETVGWTELFAWMAFAMTPIIWWLQGPSVSTDQFIVRCALLSGSGCAAVALRAAAVLRHRR